MTSRYKLGLAAIPPPARADTGQSYSNWFWGLLGIGAVVFAATRSARAEFRGED